MKLALLLSPIILLTLTDMASAGVTVNAVPSYKRNQTQPEQTKTDKTMLNQITKRFQERLSAPTSKYKLSPEQVQALATLLQNPAYSQSLRTLSDSAPQKSTIIAINQIRLEALSEFAKAADKTDPGVQDLGTLLFKLKPEVLTEDSLKNVMLFLTTLKTGIDGQVPPAELLMYAKNILSQGQGIDFEVEYVSQAATTGSGVNEIFLARNEVRVLRIGEYKGEDGTAVPIEISMKPADAEVLANNASKLADTLIDKALSPHGRESLIQEYNQEVDRELEKSTEDVGLFLKGNKILDRTSDRYKKIEDEQLHAVENINGLLRLLRDMGHKVGTHSVKGWLADKVRNAPLVGDQLKKIIPDPLDLLKTHREQIVEVDKTLFDNAKLLQDNITEIKRTQEIMGVKVHDLKIKMAMNRIIADKVRQTAQELREEGRDEEADKLVSLLGARFEKALNYALGQVAATNLINEVMNQQFEACKNLREDINTVRNTSIPLFTANEMARNINQTLQMAAETNTAIRATMEKQLLELGTQLQASNTLIIEINGKPVLDPTKLNEMADLLLSERDRMQKAHVANYKVMQTHNVAMTAAFNKIENSLGQGAGDYCETGLESLSKR